MTLGRLLTRLGQRWKLRLGLELPGLFLLSCCLVVNSDAVPMSSDSQGRLLLFSLVMVLLGAGWALATVRCPRCGLALLWEAVTHTVGKAPDDWVRHGDACPRCGFAGP